MDTEARKAEEKAKRLRSFLTSPVKLSAVFIGVVGLSMFHVYVLGHCHPYLPLPVSNRLQVAILNGAFGYCLGLFGAWITMKSLESKAKKGR